MSPGWKRDVRRYVNPRDGGGAQTRSAEAGAPQKTRRLRGGDGGRVSDELYPY
jgi:hypothetical protein